MPAAPTLQPPATTTTAAPPTTEAPLVELFARYEMLEIYNIADQDRFLRNYRIEGYKITVDDLPGVEPRATIDDLERAGVDVYPVITPSSTLMRLEYPTANLDERILTSAATAGSFTVDHVRSVATRSYLISGSIRSPER